jgi:hypothetical protein
VTFSYALPISDFIGTGTRSDLSFNVRSLGHSGYGGVTMTADFVSTLTYTYSVSVPDDAPTSLLLAFGVVAAGAGSLVRRKAASARSALMQNAECRLQNANRSALVRRCAGSAASPGGFHDEPRATRGR